MNFRQRENRQPETIKIVEPFIGFMQSKGWTCENIHGSQFQKGLPDYFCYRNGVSRWVEFKLCQPPNGYVKITDAQKVKFPQMIGGQLPVYVVGDYDLRNNEAALEEHYTRVVAGEPNLHLLLDKRLHQYIPSGFCRRK